MLIKPRISIITVSFNSEGTITETIKSVLEQTVSPYEYIIIDGKSNDETVKIAESFRAQFQQKGIIYQIISEKDTGIYNAMNKGIRMTTGDVIGMINSDDWYEPNAVEMVSKTYEKTNFDIFYGDIKIIKSTGDFVKHSKRDHFPSSRHWNHPTTFITKHIYEKYSYDENEFYADFDLILKLRKAGVHIEIVNEVLANFRFGGISNTKSVKKMLKRAKARYHIYRHNDYGKIYIVESYLMEFVKFLLA